MATEQLTEQEAQAYREELAKDWDNLPESSASAPVEEPAKKPDEQKPSEDPWSGIPPALRQTIEGINSRLGTLDTIESRLKQAESRIGGITNEMHAAKAAATQTKKEGSEAPTKTEIDSAAKSKEKWAELKEEFPEWAEAMEDRLAVERAEIKKEFGRDSGLEEKLARIETMVKDRAPAGELEELKVDIRHPGWRDEVKHQDYQAWIAIQSDDIKKKTESLYAKDAIYVLDKFKASLKEKTPTQIAKDRQKRLENSQLPAGTGGRVPQKTEMDMTDSEYRNKVTRDNWPE